MGVGAVRRMSMERGSQRTGSVGVEDIRAVLAGADAAGLANRGRRFFVGGGEVSASGAGTAAGGVESEEAGRVEAGHDEPGLGGDAAEARDALVAWLRGEDALEVRGARPWPNRERRGCSYGGEKGTYEQARLGRPGVIREAWRSSWPRATGIGGGARGRVDRWCGGARGRG